MQQILRDIYISNLYKHRKVPPLCTEEQKRSTKEHKSHFNQHQGHFVEIQY